MKVDTPYGYVTKVMVYCKSYVHEKFWLMLVIMSITSYWYFDLCRTNTIVVLYFVAFEISKIFHFLCLKTIHRTHCWWYIYINSILLAPSGKLMSYRKTLLGSAARNAWISTKCQKCGNIFIDHSFLSAWMVLTLFFCLRAFLTREEFFCN